MQNFPVLQEADIENSIGHALKFALHRWYIKLQCVFYQYLNSHNN